MGIGCRTFLIDSDDSLQRFSMARLNRLLRFDSKETLPRYAGKRVRCAMLFLEMIDRRPVGIQNMDCFVIPFDAKGRVDRKEWERSMRLAMELLPPVLDKQSSKQVIDARHRFLRRRYDHEFKWRPTRKVEEAIVDAIFRSTVTKL